MRYNSHIQQSGIFKIPKKMPGWLRYRKRRRSSAGRGYDRGIGRAGKVEMEREGEKRNLPEGPQVPRDATDGESSCHSKLIQM